MSPFRVIELYNRGVITFAECEQRVLMALTKDNIDEFVILCPWKVLRDIENTLEKRPGDNDETNWSKMRSFSIVASTDEKKIENEEREKADKVLYRRGVKLLRKHLREAEVA